MKVIFLDIDGVLNTSGHINWRFKQPKDSRLTQEHWCPIACSYLNAIADVTPGAVGIVFSSTWRLGRTIAELREILQRNNIKLPVEGKTPTFGFDPHKKSHTRGREIRSWRYEHGHTDNYVIVDDDTDMLPEQEDFFVRCNHKSGLADIKKVNKIIKILSQ